MARNTQFSDPDTQKLADMMLKNQQDLLRAFTGASSRNNNNDKADMDIVDISKNLKKADKATKDLADAFDTLLTQTKDQTDDLDDLGTSTNKYKSAIDRANDALRTSSISLNALQEEVDALAHQSIPEQQFHLKNLSKSSKGLTTETAKTIRSQSLFGASLLTSHHEIREGSLSYTTMMDEMYKSTQPLNKGMLKAAGMLDEKTGEIREGLTPEDFAKIRLSIGEADTAMAETFGKFKELGFGELEKSFEKGDSAVGETIEKFAGMDDASLEFKKQLLAAAAKLQSQGFDFGPQIVHNEGPNKGQINEAAVSKLQENPEGYKELAVGMKNLQAANGKATTGLDRMGKTANTEMGALGHKFKTLGGMSGLLAEKMGKMGGFAAVGEGLKMIADAAVDGAKKIAAFNIAQVPASLADVAVAATTMGMSLEDTTKFLQENKRAFALSGQTASEFAGQFKDTFAKAGYTMQQGAAALGPTIEAAMASGVNVRQGDALNQYLAKTADSFKDISGVMNITIEEYAKQNAQMLQSEDVQGTLLGMSKEQAAAYSDNLIALKNNYIQQGLSAEMAAELVKEQQAQKHVAVKEQLKNAAMLQLRGQAAGMSQQDSAKYAQLSLKRVKTTEESEQFLQLGKQEAKGLAERQVNADQQGLGSSLTEQAFQQSTAPTAGAALIEKAGLEAAGAERNGTKTAPAEARGLGEKSTGSQAVAEAGNTVNTLTQLLDNPFTNAIKGATVALVGLAVSSGAGGLGGAMSNIGNIAKTVGGGLVKAVGGVSLATVGAVGAVGAAAAASGTAIYAITKAAKGEDASNWISDLDKKLPGGGVGGLIGKGLDLFGPKEINPNEHTPEEEAKLAEARKKRDARLAAPKSTAAPATTPEPTNASAATPKTVTPTPAETVAAQTAAQVVATPTQTVAQQVAAVTAIVTPPPPSISAPGTDASQAEVNKSATNAAADENDVQDVQDAGAHDYLSAIADSMVQAIKLLQTISDNGNSTPADVVASKMQAAGVRKIPSASSYITGRATA